MTLRRRLLLALILAATVVAGASCSGDTTATPAERGKAIAMRAGCTSCHGATSIRALGPTWNGLAGSMVKLEDGSTIVANDAYLTESIRSPSAKKVAGYTIAMPAVQLSNEDVIALVAYIDSLAAPPATTTAG